MPSPKPLPEPTPLGPADLPVYEALRAWRRRLAAARGLPPCLLLHERTLAALARWRPATLADLRTIRGIGEAKAAAHGPALLAVLQAAGAGLPPEDALAPWMAQPADDAPAWGVARARPPDPRAPRSRRGGHHGPGPLRRVTRGRERRRRGGDAGPGRGARRG